MVTPVRHIPASWSCVARLPARTSRLFTLALAVVLPVLAAVLAACGGADGSATGGPSPSPTDPGLSPEPVPSETVTTGGASGTPVVYLLGGSSGRECVVGNASWAAAVKQAGGPSARTIDLGSTNQTFIDDQRLLKGMDRDVPTLVLIGVSVGRYTSAVSPSMLDKPLTAEDKAALAGETDVEHRYTVADVKSREAKEELVATWLAERYPLFRKNYESNARQLEKLLEACRAKGFQAAILELPMDLELIGGRFDAPREQYSEDAERFARAAGIPYITFLDELDIPTGDFYDLLHLVEPGRQKWQARLAEETAKLLNEDGMDVGE